jgi:hypothetical protein
MHATDTPYICLYLAMILVSGEPHEPTREAAMATFAKSWRRS